jgi:hypothetical protein
LWRAKKKLEDGHLRSIKDLWLVKLYTNDSNCTTWKRLEESGRESGYKNGITGAITCTEIF